VKQNTNYLKTRNSVKNSQSLISSKWFHWILYFVQVVKQYRRNWVLYYFWVKTAHRRSTQHLNIDKNIVGTPVSGDAITWILVWNIGRGRRYYLPAFSIQHTENFSGRIRKRDKGKMKWTLGSGGSFTEGNMEKVESCKPIPMIQMRCNNPRYFGVRLRIVCSV
jgi:hypothetical protein